MSFVLCVPIPPLVLLHCSPAAVDSSVGENLEDSHKKRVIMSFHLAGSTQLRGLRVLFPLLLAKVEVQLLSSVKNISLWLGSLLVVELLLSEDSDSEEMTRPSLLKLPHMSLGSALRSCPSPSSQLVPPFTFILCTNADLATFLPQRPQRTHVASFWTLLVS